MGTLTVGTTGTISGLVNNQQINSVVAALATASQGGTAPSPSSTGLSATAGVDWYDTTNNIWWWRNQADSAWIAAAALDQANGRFIFALPNFLSGLQLSNDGTNPNTVVDVEAGWAMDAANTLPMVLPSAFTKSISGTFVAGTGNHGLDTGSVAASTWYHVFLIWGSGIGTDILLSTSATSPTMPSGYTLKRRLGSIRTNSSSQIIAFSQNGDELLWDAIPFDVNVSNLGTTATAFTLSVPTGVKVYAILSVAASVSANFHITIYPPDLTGTITGTTAAQIGVFNSASTNEFYYGAPQPIRTNTSAQIKAVSDTASTTFQVFTFGWIDRRGRDG